MILCPTCPGTPGRIAFAADQDEVRCPACRTHFRVATRRVAQTTQQIPRGDRQRYRVFTAEPSGRVRMHRFDGRIGIKLLRDERVSFVWRAGRLVGVANQTTQTWYPLPAPGRTRGIVTRLALGAGVPAVGVGMWAAWPLTDPLRGLSASALITAVAIGAVCASPWLAGLRTSHETAPDATRGQKPAGPRR